MGGDGILIAAAIKRHPRQGRHPALPSGFDLLRLRAGGDLDTGFGRRGVVQIPFAGSKETNILDLDVVGNEALLSGSWCASRCGRALAQVRLERP
jgi:hypothetical protein